MRDVSEELQGRLRQAMRSELARGATLRGLAARASVGVSATSAFLRGGSIGRTTAAKWARVLGVEITVPKPQAIDAWSAAAPWAPDRVLVDASAAGVTVNVLRRGTVVRQFQGRDEAAAVEEMRRCATG